MQAVSFRNFAMTVVFCGACILSFVKITLKYSVGGPGHALQHPVFNVTPTLAIGKGQNSLLPQDDTLVVGQDVLGHNWTLGDVRRSPLGEIFVAKKDLPRLGAINIFFGDVYPSSRNRSADKANVLVYNRVPKCASSMALDLMGILSQTNEFQISTSAIYWSPINSKEDEKKLVGYWKNATQHLLFEKHMYFVDVSRYEKDLQVNWINIIRHPIDRFASMFYYMRSEERWAKLNGSLRPDEDWFGKDLSDCIMTNDPECELSSSYLMEQQFTYFCGSAPECRQMSNRKALNVAKYFAERFYSVIGITERLELTFQVLEAFLPRFFNGSSKLREEFRKNSNGTSKKKPMTSEAREKLITKLGLDLDFYNFAYQRLHKQAGLLNKLF